MCGDRIQETSKGKGRVLYCLVESVLSIKRNNAIRRAAGNVRIGNVLINQEHELVSTLLLLYMSNWQESCVARAESEGRREINKIAKGRRASLELLK